MPFCELWGCFVIDKTRKVKFLYNIIRFPLWRKTTIQLEYIETHTKKGCVTDLWHTLFLFLSNRVELEGFEPSSAQGNHTLSTCLFQPSVFEAWQDLDHQSYPYPLKFHPCNEAYMNYFRFTCTAWSTRFGTTSVERCLVPAPCAGIKLVYYTSTRQRERSYFRQLIFCSLGFRR